MNLTTVILILLAMWLVYSMMQSYWALATELKLIRQKCIINNSNSAKNDIDSDVDDPTSKMKNSLLNVLRTVKGYTY